MDAIRIGLLGVGTVGAGVFQVLARNGEEIERRSGRRLAVTHVARRDVAAARAVVGDGAEVSADPWAIVNHPDIDVVVELMGGYGLAKDLVLQAIANGKHVVTANKALLAVHGTEIFEAARQQGVVVAFEAAVAGGIPIIKTLREGLSANRVDWLAGIINGTTNFILSEMRSKGLPFEAVLAEAQRLGYAEADPTFDVEGVDAAHKLSLMSAIAFGVPVRFDQCYTEGITRLQPQDIQYAEQLGYRIKLLGVTKRVAQGVELRVHPTLVPSERLIANVEGPMNAVVAHGDAVGTVLSYGQGAGGEPTASAVVADLVDLARVIDADSAHRVPVLGFQPAHLSDLPVLPMDEVVTSYYLRLRVRDEAGVLAQLTAILAERNISIDALLQREAADVGGENSHQTDLIVLTHDTREGLMNDALTRMAGLPSVLAPITRIRKEGLA
jgi:homoserine dehydrogenase